MPDKPPVTKPAQIDPSTVSAVMRQIASLPRPRSLGNKRAQRKIKPAPVG